MRKGEAKNNTKPVIPATLETEIRRIEVQGQPRQKVRSHLNKKAEWVMYACNPSYEGDISRRIVV
jgi:hypothetical protein